MRVRHLQHHIIMIMLGSALVLSFIFSLIAYNMIQKQALDESVQLTQNLITALYPSTTAAAFSGNEAVGKDVINGLLGNEAIYSVKLDVFADELIKGMTLSGTTEKGGSGLDAIVVALKSPFDDQVVGNLTVQPNALWVQQNAMDRAKSMIMSLVVVIFSTCLMSAQMIKRLVSKPLVNVVKQLQQIKPGGEERLDVPIHLKDNEVGLLVGEFNTMLDRIKQAILVERSLRRDMETVQLSLEKAKQVAEQATHAKSNFLATMSHEIRTPMNSILGFLELALEETDLGKQTRRHLQIAQTSAKFLLQLINDILDVSKIESGKLELDSHPFDLVELLSELNDLMGIKAREKGLELNLQYSKGLAPGYIADSYRLQQILINLVGNAIKFTDKGSVDVVVKKLPENAFEFSIVDTGIGIAEDKIDLILKPFTQVDASMTRQFGGTGLGTTISSELVQLMGGTLKIQSIFGKGSRFYFTLILAPCAQLSQPKSKVLPRGKQSRKLRILLVDDVLENITLAQIRLEKAGHITDTAKNGLEAVDATLAQRFDLILMDLQMPEMDGYEATKAIRLQTVHEGHNTTVPIVALTANAMKEVQEKVIAAGMDEFVVKPIDFDQLFTTINTLTQTDAVDVDHTVTADIEAIESAMSSTVIDFEAAINAWLEEKAFYKAVGNFAKRNQDTATELADLVESGQRDETDSLIHKIKGAAGNLRLTKLYDCSCQLEDILTKEPPTSALIMPILSALSETLVAIENIPALAKPKPVMSKVATEMRPQCTNCFKALLDACEQHDPDAAEEALAQLTQYIESDKLTAIDQQLQNFEFIDASMLLNQLANELEIETKTP